MGRNLNLGDVVFPTHVGMNRIYDIYGLDIKGIPHARGDEPNHIVPTAKVFAYSPRTWG